jgi:hypothetical protein
MPVYHYYAMKQISIGKVAHIDGIAIMEKAVATMDDYRRLKEFIAEMDGPEGMTICSLTMLEDIDT